VRKSLKFGIFTFIAGIFIYFLPLLYLILRIQPTEIYPEVANLDLIDNKKALIIVAHHDDMFGCVAITKWLCDNNWDVRAFYFKPPPYRRDSIRERNGILSTSKVEEIIGLKEFTLIDQPLRKETSIGELNIPYAEFKNVFEIDSVTSAISDLIANFKPSVIFTLDNVIGFYGHSDHVFVSRTINNVCQQNKSNPSFPVQLIYQTVLPPSQAKGVMVDYQKLHHFRNFWGIRELLKHRGFNESIYTKAKEIYDCDGMPSPNVQFKIDSLSMCKRRFLVSWAPSEKKNLKRFIPFCYWYPNWIFYKIFNYEYFRENKIH
jgi:hypothetical protein